MAVHGAQVKRPRALPPGREHAAGPGLTRRLQPGGRLSRPGDALGREREPGMMGCVVLGLPFPTERFQWGGRSFAAGPGRGGPARRPHGGHGGGGSLCQAGTAGSGAGLVERLPCRLQSGGLARSLHRFFPTFFARGVWGRARGVFLPGLAGCVWGWGLRPCGWRGGFSSPRENGWAALCL